MKGTRGTRTGRSLIAATLLAVALLTGAAAPPALSAPAPVSADAPPAVAEAPRPKVVIIVGPTEELTAGFRAEAQAAARAARRYTDNVITIYSPNATWQAVRRALQGASLVVYMGHGNGWPSIHRASPYPRTQNGLGLNLPGGSDDHSHRYYGEFYLARDVQLAPGAVVLLHHLCYAAGNSEPGLPEGPHDVAKQRVDNFAAGWLAAGASAVVAEAYFAPSYYVRAVLGTDRHIEAIWRSSPTFKNNVDSWPSTRTAKATALIDPDRNGRYGRSLVYTGKRSRLGVERTAGAPSTSETKVATQTEVAPPPPEPPPHPLAGVLLDTPVLSGPFVIGAEVEMSVPFALRDGATIPANLMIGATWTPIEIDSGAVLLEDIVATAQADPEEPPDIEERPDLEEFQRVLEPVTATAGRRALRIPLPLPESAGLYQLDVTPHTANGTLLEPPDGMAEAIRVYVAPPLSAGLDVPAHLEALAGEVISFSGLVVNNGTVAWEQHEFDVLEESGPDGLLAGERAPAHLVVRVIAVDGEQGAFLLLDAPAAAIEAPIAPGDSSSLKLSVTVPESAGDYLLVIDVVTPSYGSLAERGVRPAVVRLTVEAQPPAGSRL